MLYEPDVSAAVVKYLYGLGYAEIRELGPTQKGIDIIAKKDSETLCIEVKGETSFRKGSNRFGKPFHSGQVEHHVARAVFASLKVYDKQNENTKVAMAFPDTPEFSKRINTVINTLKKLEIAVYLVGADLSVKKL